MDWNLEGKRVKGVYKDLFLYTGTIINSRVGLSGRVKHDVEVDQPFKFYGETRRKIIVSHEEFRLLCTDGSFGVDYLANLEDAN